MLAIWKEIHLTSRPFRLAPLSLLPRTVTESLSLIFCSVLTCVVNTSTFFIFLPNNLSGTHMCFVTELVGNSVYDVNFETVIHKEVPEKIQGYFQNKFSVIQFCVMKFETWINTAMYITAFTVINWSWHSSLTSRQTTSLRATIGRPVIWMFEVMPTDANCLWWLSATWCLSTWVYILCSLNKIT